MTHSIEIRTLDKGEWAVLRELRLQALTDAPAAFASTATRESGFAESDWHTRMESCSWFVAWEDQHQVGLVAGSAEFGDSPDDRHLLSLWVAPPWRRRGVAHSLVETVAAWAADDAATSLSLWVADNNVPAIALYERLGFQRTGLAQPFPTDSSRQEVRMIRHLGDPPD
ncbi:GNAT family N-acetyltransferase [Frankia sp. CNm7]|uniref:GNAT family N-acetyltransferase n=1 Tax=Frankia nepalensis TaxID=1836974 RepID=A0A937RKP1_9ACTN|nr:GNAT family N-acetyltransferase [Frankia nepalensis]MBL7518609.1 GNAT family N-acetyltransferase [Frankia nepalensis]MBL7630619.1 GNAT family N-acetyltransferase [Frankia nepalensis]